jgi:hypothetical protein
MKKLSTAVCLIIFIIISGNLYAQADDLVSELKEYIEENHVLPEAYVIDKFADHDVVILGETHRIKHNVEFVQDLIPLLYDNGIYYLGTEFARREDQSLIDSLLAGEVYDEALARHITFLSFVEWGYQEYVDIFKAAWQLNHRLDDDSRKFRILALNDSPDWSHLKSDADRDDNEVMQQVWKGGGEHLWARRILDSVVIKNEKILVYCGMHHAFSKYKQPIVMNGEFIRFDESRMGNHLYDSLGERVMTICLHFAWPGSGGYDGEMVHAGDGIIDRLISQLDPKYDRAGFDTHGTPFEKVTGENSVYKHGYDNFTLATFCDGYIIEKKLSDYEGVTPISDFINDENIDFARRQSPNPDFRAKSVQDFNRSILNSTRIENQIPRE